MPGKHINHDAAYKAFFSDPAMVWSLLLDFAPYYIIRDLDLNTLEQCPASYTTINLSQRHDDIVWRLRYKDAWCYIYILLEFQSVPDRWMALRILNYMTLLWQDLIGKGHLENGKKLPPVFPMVIYNGDPVWSAPLDISGLVETVSEELGAYQPRQKYFLLDEKRMPNLLLDGAKGESAYIFRIERAKTLAEVKKLLNELLAKISAGHQDALRRNIFNWIAQLATGKETGDPTHLKVPVEDAHMLEQRFREWEKEYIQKGMALGEAKGMAIGEAKGMALGEAKGMALGEARGIALGEAKGIANQKNTLLEMLHDRFGEIPPAWKSAISELNDANILGQLTRAILRIKTLEEYGGLLEDMTKN